MFQLNINDMYALLTGGNKGGGNATRSHYSLGLINSMSHQRKQAYCQCGRGLHATFCSDRDANPPGSTDRLLRRGMGGGMQEG